MDLARTAFALLCLLCLAACDRLPESYPPPQQRPPLTGVNLGPSAMMVSMDGPEADALFVKDIYWRFGDAPWRWSKREPTVKVLVVSAENIKFSADFAIWDESFKSTGPLEISFLVNGKLLDKIRYTSPGDKHFEKPVPAAWLAANTEATVAMSIDKLYTAPRDKAQFGVILARMGLKP
jgi:hypothetical protein